MDRLTLIERLREVAARTDGLELLVLVGSHARGDTHALSDVDLAYLAGPSMDVGGLIGEASIALGTDHVDAADLDRANGLFRFEAARDGVLVHGDAERWHHFRFTAVSFWCDAGPIIRAGYDDILASLT